MPIGNQTNQLLGLVYLDKIDRLIKEKLQTKYYTRYMDDFILVHSCKEYLQYCLASTSKLLIEEPQLILNKKNDIASLKNEIPYLGFRHFVEQNGKVFRLVNNQRENKVKRVVKFLNNNSGIDSKIKIQSFVANLSHGNTYRLCKKLKIL